MDYRFVYMKQPFYFVDFSYFWSLFLRCRLMYACVHWCTQRLCYLGYFQNSPNHLHSHATPGSLWKLSCSREHGDPESSGQTWRSSSFKRASSWRRFRQHTMLNGRAARDIRLHAHTQQQMRAIKEVFFISHPPGC